MTVDTLPSRPQASAAAVTLERLALRTTLNLRGDPADAGFLDAVKQATGLTLPTDANTWTEGGSRRAVWLGPDEWLVVAPDDTAEALEQAVRTARGGDPWLSVTNVSHNSTVFRLAGPAARMVLAKATPIDLHPRAFGANACAQTVLARTRALILLAEAQAPAFEVWVRNSFAQYTADWLEDAMLEYQSPP
ncbi:Sarcosine oxidase gamma subunit [Caenispirillum salinarum AK4]|uniref:Sarcosine oxidase gamma subunit n=1 Tax=Caenispirillum salinarum AK4 TaxID=1238182 RepID=K9GQM4_9PROT|nr:sarcosine oxidase subunit gamma family protein [Caenispirillum salinarum]EKV27034.1 Sarcosine oxidase gamma subunit [Caenispirillum salinarum AK4]